VPNAEVGATAWPAVDRLLDDALSLPPAQRLAWLAALPAEHAPLRATLARLLAMQAGLETDDFLRTLPKLAATPADGAQAGLPGPGASTVVPEPDSVVGPWRLLRELGHGGMGSVWLAERADGSLRRQVALKLPRLSWARDLAERMARERDIVASLEHPNIARLYDAGVDPLGRPWLALEFVDGQPIDVHARERNLSTRARLALLLQVAAAVGYAHGRLVIHRDLKPSNILVTAAGEVKLLDFGIAKLIEGERAEATALTQWAGRALTPNYASPEQVRGEPLGTASDVYSLGVVAFELLAGTRPYRLKRGSAAELEEAIASLDAPRASTLANDAATARALRGDLDAILAQALRKHPAERYPTVQALAEDWQRHLDGRPVRAMPDRLAYRLGRTLRRHWLPASAAAVTATALVAGATVALWQAQAARTAQARAEQEAATARAVQGFLESVFLENRGDQRDPGLRREATARDLLDRGAERVATDLRDAPAARLRLLQVLGGMYEDLNEVDRMRALYQMRVDQARVLPGAERARETALALADLAHAEAVSGREADARTRLDEAEALLARDPDPDVKLRILLRRGSVHRADDPARGAQAAEAALELSRTRPPSTDRVLATYLVAEHGIYGDAPRRGVDLLDEVIPLVEKRPELGASVLAPLHALRGDGLAQLGEAGAAETAYRRAIEVERLRGTTGITPNYLAMRLGFFLYDQGRWRDSAEALEPAWHWARGLTTGFDTTAPMAAAGHGRALLAMGRLEQASAVLQVAVRQARSLQDAPDIVPRILLFKAQAWIEQGRWQEAESAIRDAEAVVRERQVGGGALVDITRLELRMARGEGRQALADWQAQRRAAGKPLVPDAGDEPEALALSARLHLAAGDAATARELAQALLAADSAPAASRDATRAPESARRLPSPGAAMAQTLVGRAWLASGRPDLAVPALTTATQAWRDLADPALSLDLALALRDLAEAQRRTGAGAASRVSRDEAAAILARHPKLGPQHRRAAGAAAG
jgi:serine/threonine-protein kinase